MRSFRRSARLREAVESTATKNSTGNGNGKSRFSETSSNAVAYWLLASAASVFGIVVFGGLTRLTESGYVPLRLVYTLPDTNTLHTGSPSPNGAQ